MPRQSLLLRGAILLAGGLFASASLYAQLPVREMRVQLAAGFNPVQGRLITAGDTIIFIDDAQPQYSFFANRAQIERLGAEGGQPLTIQFKEPVRDRDGDRIRVEFKASPEDSEMLKTWFSQAASSSRASSNDPAQPAQFPTYSVRRDKLIGGDNGRLVVQADRLAFEADSPEASREWLFSGIREVKQKGPYRLEISPFSGDKYNLELLGSGGMAREDFQRLANNIARARSKR
ncbi:MAG: hypothetical protein ABJF23_15900 [Bryobacteraceae bacterium]